MDFHGVFVLDFVVSVFEPEKSTSLPYVDMIAYRSLYGCVSVCVWVYLCL